MSGFAFACAGPADAQNPLVHANGDGLSVDAFRVGKLDFDGGSLRAPQIDGVLVLNLRTLSLEVLDRDLGESHLALARIRRGDNGAPAIEPLVLRLPETRIPRSLATLQAGKALRIRCFGSSLVAGGAGERGWQRLVFAPALVGESLGVPAPQNTSVQSHAVGGTNSRYTFALLDDSIDRGGGRAFDCDLAIIALLPNGGIDRLPIFEGVVRQFRRRGIEVLLLTDNSFADRRNNDALWSDGEFVARLARHYGCALADTAAWMRAAQTRGEPVFADSIHSTPDGQLAWARAVSGLLAHPIPLPAAATAFDPAAAFPAPLQPAVPTAVRVELSPVHVGGKLTEPAPDNQIATFYQAPSRVLELSPGEELLLDRLGSQSIDLIFDVSSSFLAEEIMPAGTLSSTGSRTFAYTAPPRIPSRPQTLTLFAANDERVPLELPLRLRVREGVLRLYAIAYHLAP